VIVPVPEVVNEPPVPTTKALALVAAVMLSKETLTFVKLEPLRTGKAPPAVVWTSCETPLKLLPCRVTLVLRRLLLRVPLEILDALRAVRPEPLPVKELDELEKVLIPLKVWLAFSLAI
jgi:hypothetical protein